MSPYQFEMAMIIRGCVPVWTNKTQESTRQTGKSLGRKIHLYIEL